MQGSHEDPERTELLATRSPAAGTQAAEGEALPAGARLGRYRIESLLGRGGMGDVYRAEQLEPVRRTVALKLLRAQRLDARHLAYFEVERQLLAQMRHPAIAQVYDADTTADGHPFFAMEFIAGSPITRFCDERSLPLDERVALFIRACEGVQHAHQKGVIHRDLKPGNLLVDEVDGRALPKIIDFGIATATSLTEDRDAAGTPDYMSPEQAGGDQSLVDTRSDVYALGVVLCELLTGQRPASAGETVTGQGRTLRLPSEQLSTLSPQDAERFVREHGQPPARMRKLLRGELDWVVAKAMRHDRNDRYASAAALADDLQRFLDGRPLLAVPPSRRYVLAKFAQRHRVGIVAGAVVSLALVAGLAMSVYGLLQARAQRAIAEQRSAQLEKVAAFQQSMLEGIDVESMGIGMADGLRRQVEHDSPQDAPAFERGLAQASTADIARGLIDHDILANAERAIGRDFDAEPALAADLRESVARVRIALGLPQAAAAGFAQVADYRAKTLGAHAPETLKARQEQAGALLDAADPKQALALAQSSLRDAASLPPRDDVRIRLRMDEAEAISALGDRPRARKLLEALRGDSLELRGEGDPATMEVTNNLAILLGRMGESKAGRDLLEKLVPLRIRILGKDDADTLSSLHNLAVMRIMTGDKDGAVALQRGLVETQTRRLGAEHPQTLAERGNLSNMLIDSGKAKEALPIATAVLDADTRVLGAEHPQTVRAKLNLSSLYARLGQFDKTLAMQQEMIDTRTRLLGPRHPDTLYIMVNRAGTLHQAKRSKESLAMLQWLLPEVREVLGPQHPQTQAALQVQADDADDLGDTRLEIASYRELLDARAAALGADDPRTVDAAWNLEGLLRDGGDAAAADVVRKRYVEPLLAAKPDTLSEGQAKMAENIRKTEAEEAASAAHAVAK
ncbi:serine/threonine protein kinase [Pseudoluteimonas lycopersici]|uniref:Serine/threonine protein kinase n=1 Tax=Pseudoluteimonas lycopersici TaxID=1324796 RepID=A0A516V2B9_9GAMM|nr:serine/threonine-protein kinase [Lysobacter lycopersici]QDQ72661.1 serine/threonine protein kinase [Lysobacter lycopersici]